MDTLGGAIALGSRLSGEAANLLIGIAREAFLAGLRFCAAISMFGAVALIAFVLVRLRNVALSSHPAEEQRP
jgi:hypothetical protein